MHTSIACKFSASHTTTTTTRRLTLTELFIIKAAIPNLALKEFTDRFYDSWILTCQTKSSAIRLLILVSLVFLYSRQMALSCLV